MGFMNWQLKLAVAAPLCLAACGTPGAPRPPSLQLPSAVTDLTARRQGNNVLLAWTAPQQTTDKQNIRKPGQVRVCRAINTRAMTRCREIAELPPEPPLTEAGTPRQRTYTDALPSDFQQKYPTGFVTYAVESLSRNGHSAGLSNQPEVPLAPTLPPPAKLQARVTPNTIEVTATGVAREPAGWQFQLHLYRQGEGANTVIDLGPPAAVHVSGGNYVATFVDRGFRWGSSYFYRVAAVTTANPSGKPAEQIQGEFSPPLPVTARDVFPPAAPSGLQAAAAGVGQPPFVDLSWAPNPAADLAGYNVYRRQEDEKPRKINQAMVKTPAYRDLDVNSGQKYFYSVTAVDTAGNESVPSREASESVP